MPIVVNSLLTGTSRTYPNGTAAIVVPDTGVHDVVNTSGAPVTIQMATGATAVPDGAVWSFHGRGIGSPDPNAVNAATKKSSAKR